MDTLHSLALLLRRHKRKTLSATLLLILYTLYKTNRHTLLLEKSLSKLQAKVMLEVQKTMDRNQRCQMELEALRQVISCIRREDTVQTGRHFQIESLTKALQSGLRGEEQREATQTFIANTYGYVVVALAQQPLLQVITGMKHVLPKVMVRMGR